MKKSKEATITFKVDRALAEALKGLPNRSEFIRAALADALESTCPLCLGSGFLNPDQKRHWDRFARDHEVKQCRKCNEMHIVCSAPEKRKKDAVH